tara:strand:+ start:402 stop:1817 length:1416 start_codon:yes stop_codon:yes gene_type:complete
MHRQGITGVAQYLASKGRNGDDSVAHVSQGETIIPQQILARNPKLKEGIEKAFTSEQINPDKYVVGSGIMSINPQTNLPEFGLGTEFKKFIKKAGPIIGTVVGFMIGGPAGATIGAGIGSKTSNLDDREILRNMALAHTASNVAAGAGIGGATSSAGQAASTAGGWSAPFSAAKAGTQAFFEGANWTPTVAGQAGIGGFYQDIGSGFARSMGLGGTQTLVDAGLTKGQANLVTKTMADTGLDAVKAAQAVGITDSTILTNLANAGPGLTRSLASGYGNLNPLQKFGVNTATDLAMGLHQNAGMGGYDRRDGAVPEYFTRNLRSGPQINSESVLPSQTGVAGLPQLNTSMSNSNDRTNMTISKNDILLDRLADGIMSVSDVTSPFPSFETFENLDEPIRANTGGFIGHNRTMFNRGGHITGLGGPKDDLIDAKLSNNEFVFTEKAVRGAGNGSINKGAENMYQLMNNFERRV